MGRARPPAASIWRAVVSRLPGTGSPPVEADSSNASPSRMVRAVMATSRPARARASADALPMPRLAPVTSAMRRSTDMEARVPSPRRGVPRGGSFRTCDRPGSRRRSPGDGQIMRAFSRRLMARRRRRSRSFVPAQYPTRSGTASAYLRHSARTVQRAHNCLARAVGPPRSGMNISTRSPRHARQGLPPRAPEQLHDHRRDAVDGVLARGLARGLRGHGEAGHVQAFGTPDQPL